MSIFVGSRNWWRVERGKERERTNYNRLTREKRLLDKLNHQQEPGKFVQLQKRNRKMIGGCLKSKFPTITYIKFQISVIMWRLCVLKTTWFLHISFFLLCRSQRRSLYEGVNALDYFYSMWADARFSVRLCIISYYPKNAIMNRQKIFMIMSSLTVCSPDEDMIIKIKQNFISQF